MDIGDNDCNSIPLFSSVKDTIKDLTQNASGIPVPLIVSLLTYSCDGEHPRSFSELALLYSTSQKEMPFAGAIISEWHRHELEGDSAASLMTWNPVTNASLPSTASDGLNNSTPILPAFTNLQQAWQKLMPTGVHIDDYSPLLVPPPCPTVPLTMDTLPDEGWQVNGSVPLPTRGQN
jgi:hypothetical protein